MDKNFCVNCKSNELEKINTYKRYWLLCNECGTANAIQKDKYLLSFLPRNYLKKDKNIGFSSIYDYMASKENVEQSLVDFKGFKIRFSPFIEDFLCETPKNILDISGGNGNFLKSFDNGKNNLVLTEINQKSLDYARKELSMTAIYYDLNEQTLEEALNSNNIKQKFDLIMVRACTMFIKNLDSFTKSIKSKLNKDGLIIINRNVQPTIGTFMRTQFDEFSYLILRQPKIFVESLEENNLKVIKHDADHDFWDFYLNYYDRDLLGLSIISYYTFKTILRLRKNLLNGKEKFSFRRRDRHMFYIVATHC